MEKYIAFPNDGYKRTNFTNEEFNNLDLVDEKEYKILELFDNFMTNNR